MRARPFFTLLLLLSIPTLAAAGPYYVRGNFYCHDGETGTDTGGQCWGWDAGNEMFDDGAHGDGAANDGIYGAYVTCDQAAGRFEWKVGTQDWSESFPSAPSDPFANAVLFTSGSGDVIHFVLDQRFMNDGWQPYFNAVQCDHALPPGAELEVIGSAPEIGSWLSGVPLYRTAQGWHRFITVSTPGYYEFKLRVVGTWDVANFGWDYNNTQGRNAFLVTTHADTDVLFQMDEQLGRVRAIELGPTPTRRDSWGKLKSLFR